VFAGRRAAVKALLLDQRLVAGVGNIYADEALWAAKIHPETPGGLVSRAKLDVLAVALREVLEAGIQAQGSTLRDFRTPDGGYGSMQERFQVFDRTGEPCPRCGRPIVKLRVAQRGTHVCPHCQRRRRA
jgi:formamidopyrimidine-DNA glycosylase